MRTNTETLAQALDILARDIESPDGVANAAIREAAERLREMRYEELEQAVVGWARARQIIQNGTATSQLLKAIAEMGELADAFNKGDRVGIVDGLGDVLVCLINFAEIERLSLVECLESAYNEIKDRRGTLMPNGVFVKES